MPNWCNNHVKFSHADKDMVERVAKAAADNRLFMEFYPTPAALREITSPVHDETVAKEMIEKYGAADWYNWNVENWGTKWDVDSADVVLEDDNSMVSLWFDTAWSPPIEFYAKMASLGFTVEALYNEPGMGFAGAWNDEDGDEYHEYDFSDPDWDEDMSDTVKEFLQYEYENYLMWQEEEVANA